MYMELSELLNLPAAPTVWLEPGEIPFQALCKAAQHDPMVWHIPVRCKAEECQGYPSLTFCRHNPIHSLTATDAEPIVAAERKQRELDRKLREQTELTGDDNSSAKEFFQTDMLTPNGRRKRGSVLKALPEELHQKALDMYNAYLNGEAKDGVTAIALILNVQQPWLKDFYIEHGLPVGHGLHWAIKKRQQQLPSSPERKVTTKPKPTTTVAARPVKRAAKTTNKKQQQPKPKRVFTEEHRAKLRAAKAKKKTITS